MAMKILVIGHIAKGFRFYGPILDDEDWDWAALEECLTESPEERCFFVELQPIPEDE